MARHAVVRLPEEAERHGGRMGAAVVALEDSGVVRVRIEREGVRVGVVVLGRSDRRRCSGYRAVSQLAMAASLGMAAVRTVGGIPGVVVGVRRWPWVSSSSRAQAGRSCWIRGTCP